ncbi:EAL domain-containing protein, partial [Brucella intermedia]|uniref:EAL domain-containing protein n=1 Tax=Brucella intermedia TaxID=94625 RepID=UPI002360B0D3
WISWTIVTEEELGRLDLLAHRVITRAGSTFAEAKAALAVLSPSPLVPCSPEHIARMREETAASSSIEEIGYFHEGVLQCSSWGLAQGVYRRPAASFARDDGLYVTLRAKPQAGSTPMTALQAGAYSVFVLPSRFIDVVIDEDVAITLMTDEGRPVAWRGRATVDREWLSLHPVPRGRSGGYFHTVQRGDGLVAAVMQSQAAIAARYGRELVVLLPVGGFIALFIVAIVIWLSRRRLSPEAELELGVRNREFHVLYQPIIELKSGICVGAEALVRWRRPDGVEVRPDLFIGLAEETGLTGQITDQVIDAVIGELQATLEQDRSLHVAINLGADDIRTGRILDVLERKLQPTDIRPQQVWLEATERSFIEVEPACVTLSRARERGHSVAIDDFGTGYSSLACLQNLPLDTLKIDKSFVETIDRDSATSSVILHIIDMARDLGYFLVAEGIETPEQLRFLKNHSVDFGQGWLFAKPMPAESFIAFLRQHEHQYGRAPEIIRVRD